MSQELINEQSLILSCVSSLPARRSKLLLSVLILFACSACRLHSVDEDVLPELPLPSQYSSSGSPSVNKAPTLSKLQRAKSKDGRWWRDFGDAQLNRLMNQAFSDNFDLKAAWARLKQSQELVSQANAALIPEVTGNFNAQRSRSVLQIGAFGDQVFKNTTYSANLAASYEIDLWGRVLSQRLAVGEELDASRLDVEALAMTVSGQIAEVWIRILEQRAQIELLNRQLKVNKELLGLIEFRSTQTEVSALDVLQQRQQLQSTKTQVPLAEAQLKVREHQMNVLLGRDPKKALPSGKLLPLCPDFPELGLPADLLERRPDLQAAKRRLIAADHRVAAAVADRLPAIRLNGQVGYQSFDITTLFSKLVGNMAGGIAAPIIDGGRRAAEVDRTKAVVKERLYDYSQRFLNAMQDVENAMVQELQQARHIKELRKQYELAKQSLEQAQQRYRSGLSDYLPVLTSLQSVQNIERTVLSAERDHLLFRVQLYRGLGGTWTQSLKTPLEDASNDSKGQSSGDSP